MTAFNAYQDRLMTPEQALALIESNHLVYLNVGTPVPVATLLDARIRELGSVDMRMVVTGYLPFFDSERDAGEREIELFIGEPSRSSHDTQRSTYLPNTFMPVSYTHLTLPTTPYV